MNMIVYFTPKKYYLKVIRVKQSRPVRPALPDFWESEAFVRCRRLPVRLADGEEYIELIKISSRKARCCRIVIED